MSPLIEMPRFIAPMLARSAPVPEGDDWALEVKFDGMRAQVRLDGRSLCLRSRPGRDCTAEFPELGAMIESLAKRRVILDGELVCFADDGNPVFERLRGRLNLDGKAAARASTRAPATFLAFDLLHLDRRSTLGLPHRKRRELLEELQLEGPAWSTPRNFVGERDAVLASTRKRGLEGVVAKRLDSPYKPGARNGAWVKHKHRRCEEFLITAWAPAQPSRPESFFLARRLADGTVESAGSVSSGSAARRGSDCVESFRRWSCRTDGATSASGRSSRASLPRSTSMVPGGVRYGTRCCEG